LVWIRLLAYLRLESTRYIIDFGFDMLHVSFESFSQVSLRFVWQEQLNCKFYLSPVAVLFILSNLLLFNKVLFFYFAILRLLIVAARKSDIVEWITAE
jgi:hypothetical protein